MFLYILIHREKFQSTPSAWRETRADYVSQQRWLDFNPLPPHGGRLYILDECKLTERISIHSLRMEGDAHNPKSFRNMDISIHSLHTEGDLH